MVSDFDGTLYTDEGVIEKRVIDKIKEYNSAGGYFTVCTGRTFHGFHRYSPEFINAPVLLANGAFCYDYAKNEIVFFDGLGTECFELIREVRDRFPNVSIEMYCQPDVFVINNNDSSRRHFETLQTAYNEITDPSETNPPFQKVMFGCEGFGGEPVPFEDEKRSPASFSSEIQELIRTEYPAVNYLPTTGRWVEVLKKGVDKGSGMLKLADRLGVAHSDTYAIGDGYNDVDMLSAAGDSFVPENGGAEAKQAGKHIVPSNNEGAVMHALAMILDKR